jgi:hypothetical protein
MITSFEVGAVFRIVNEASPALTRILRQIRELNVALDKAKASLSALNKPPALLGAIAETDKLATAWADVAANAARARLAIGNVNNASRLALAGPPPGSGGVGGGGRGGGGGGGRHRPGWLGGGGGGVHVSGPGASIPGGGHIRFGGAGMAGAGLLGYAGYQAAETQDAVWQLLYHSGQDQHDPVAAKKMRDAVQNAMLASGYNVHDVGEAALQEMRMFQGTPGKGIDILPEMLEIASKEARAKGSSLTESMKSFIGLAHMTQAYSPEEIKKLAPAFAYMSVANPTSLSSIERAAGYAVPLLKSGLGVDPLDSLLLGTVLTRAGATSTKSGTWLREMALRAMPGTSMMSKMAFKKHEEALKAFGLVDDNNKPTWFTDGKPDLLKMLDIAGARAQTIPFEKRAAYERGLFGAQGGGGFALLSDPAVRGQISALRKERDSPEFQNRYRAFLPDYANGSTVQNARVTMQEFNVTLADIGQRVLPAVNGALKDFKGVLERIRNVLPGAPTGDGVIGKRVLQGAGAGALYGMAGGPGGVVGGAIIGGAGMGVEGILEQYMKNHPSGGAVKEEMKSLLKRGPEVGAQPIPNTNIAINLDGETIAQSVIKWITKNSTFHLAAPASDGSQSYGP